MHNQLEKYISKIEDQLVMLPGEQRREEVREIRSHLERMIEENIARGCDADEAVTKAIEQFGPADIVGKSLDSSHEASPQQKNKTKIRMLVICALIYSTNLILYLLTSSGFIAHSYELTSGYLDFTGVIAMFACGWMNESINHKKLDVFFIKAFPAICLFLLFEMFALHLKNFLFLPMLIFISMAAGARAYRWFGQQQGHSNWKQN